MTTINLDPRQRLRRQPSGFARNGLVVSAQQQTQMATLANYVARFRTKELFRSAGGGLGSIGASTWRFAGHTSPYAGMIVARVVIAKVSTSGNVPGFTLTMFDSSGNVLGGQSIAQQLAGIQAGNSGMFIGGQANGETLTDGPNEWIVGTVGVDASTFRDTDVRGVISSSGAGRLVSATCYEIGAFPDTSNGYIDQQASAGRSILDADRSTIQTMAIALWKRGGAPLGHFSSQTDATAPTTTSAGNVTVVDISAGHSSTSPLPYTPGFLSDLSYHHRLVSNPTAVPVRFEACFSVSGGGTGTVLITDTNGAGSISVSGAPGTTPTWFQTTGFLPANLNKQDLYFKTSAGTITLYAASLYQYLA